MKKLVFLIVLISFNYGHTYLSSCGLNKNNQTISTVEIEVIKNTKCAGGFGYSRITGNGIFVIKGCISSSLVRTEGTHRACLDIGSSGGVTVTAAEEIGAE